MGLARAVRVPLMLVNTSHSRFYLKNKGETEVDGPLQAIRKVQPIPNSEIG